MIIVSNTTPLSELAKVGKMHLLQEIFGRVIIPQQVYNEVTVGDHPAVEQVQSATWLEIRTIVNQEKIINLQEQTGLDLGESAAIILAEELNAQRLLMDEWVGRKVAKARNLPIIGTVGILLVAKQQGLIPNVKPILDDLMVAGKRISPSLYQDVLNTAEEL
jgi:predicted nucleic acid-binding protein